MSAAPAATRAPRVLLLAPDDAPTPDDPGGAAALLRSRVDLLLACGAQVDLLQLRDPARPGRLADFMAARPDAWRALRDRLADHDVLELPRPRRARAPLRHALRTARDPLALVADLALETRRRFDAALAGRRADLLWAEQLVPATWLAGWAQRTGDRRPRVWGHYDWYSRIKSLRASGRLDPRRWLRHAQIERGETALLQRFDALVSGSASEAEDARGRGAHRALWLPLTHPIGAEPRVPMPADAPAPRVVHLGGMATTATRRGLARFLDVTWPRVVALCARRDQAPPPLWVIGSLRGADADLRRRLDAVDAHCPGFVPDLDTALRPGDVHVAPWEHDTGTRTRVPRALARGQALVALDVVRRGVPVLVDGANVALAADLRSMADALVDLLDDPARRLRLARAGRDTFRRTFTVDAARPHLAALLRDFLPHDDLR
ncbi:MAG: glycosyltransferase [Acidobacteriota bacterium]